MEKMRATFIKAMKDIEADLVKTLTFEVGTDVQSTLTLAYDRYEDLNRSEDIFDRNVNIKHPGFMPNLENISILDR
jgi:prophage DNA circulation protein